MTCAIEREREKKEGQRAAPDAVVVFAARPAHMAPCAAVGPAAGPGTSHWSTCHALVHLRRAARQGRRGPRRGVATTCRGRRRWRPAGSPGDLHHRRRRCTQHPRHKYSSLLGKLMYSCITTSVLKFVKELLVLLIRARLIM